MIGGDIECGPNAVFTFKREGYQKTDFSWKDTFEAISFLGTWRLFINHWKFGLNEYRRAFSKALFICSLVICFLVQKINSISETFGVGTLIAIPSSFPFNDGMISPIDFDAPVDVGTID